MREGRAQVVAGRAPRGQRLEVRGAAQRLKVRPQARVAQVHLLHVGHRDRPGGQQAADAHGGAAGVAAVEHEHRQVRRASRLLHGEAAGLRVVHGALRQGNALVADDLPRGGRVAVLEGHGGGLRGQGAGGQHGQHLVRAGVDQHVRRGVLGQRGALGGSGTAGQGVVPADVQLRETPGARPVQQGAGHGEVAFAVRGVRFARQRDERVHGLPGAGRPGAQGFQPRQRLCGTQRARAGLHQPAVRQGVQRGDQRAVLGLRLQPRAQGRRVRAPLRVAQQRGRRDVRRAAPQVRDQGRQDPRGRAGIQGQQRLRVRAAQRPTQREGQGGQRAQQNRTGELHTPERTGAA